MTNVPETVDALPEAPGTRVSSQHVVFYRDAEGLLQVQEVYGGERELKKFFSSLDPSSTQDVIGYKWTKKIVPQVKQMLSF